MADSWWRILLAGILLIFLSSYAHSTELVETNESSLTNSNVKETVSIEREEELWSLVRNFVKRKYFKKGVTTWEAKRWNKLLSDKTQTEQRLMWRMYLEIKIETFPEEPELLEYRGMEEVYVTGYQFEQFDKFDQLEFTGMDPSEFSVVDFAHLRDVRKDANLLYREGRYDEAYPILLELAKRGFKDAQSRLAYILFTGTEDVQKSNLRALGWLGVAAYDDTEPAFRKLFNRYVQQVPHQAREIVVEVVTKYIETFGFPEHISCSTDHRYNEGPVKRTYCQFKLESIARACFPHDCWANRVNRKDE